VATTRLRLRVVPGATRQPGVVGRYGDAWKIRVAAPSERGAANEAVIRLLAGTLRVPPGAVRLVAGHGSRDKIVEVAGIDPADIEARLASADRERKGA
jgi:uncharacterized protein YggU (UPF0235/DUF167 family)